MTKKTSKSRKSKTQSTNRPKPVSGVASVNRRYSCGGKLKKGSR